MQRVAVGLGLGLIGIGAGVNYTRYSHKKDAEKYSDCAMRYLLPHLQGDWFRLAQYKRILALEIEGKREWVVELPENPKDLGGIFAFFRRSFPPSGGKLRSIALSNEREIRVISFCGDNVVGSKTFPL